MRLLVCGGRSYKDKEMVFRVLDACHAKRPVALLIHGDCPTGADRFADDWAKARSVKIKSFPADWEKMGRAAGPVRNKQMRDEGRPDGAVAFPGGVGTAGMVKLLNEHLIKVWEPCKQTSCRIKAE